MTQKFPHDKVELHLVRVLQTVVAEGSVSRAAMRLGLTQPQVSVRLKQLRALTGDPLLVRAGKGMVPTEAAQRWAESAARILDEADRMFSPRLRRSGFDPARDAAAFRIAASDYMDPFFLPELVAQVKQAAPSVTLDLLALSDEFDYRQSLASGQVDLVIGNWVQPPQELHLGRLMTDEVVCMVSQDHPVARQAATRKWTLEAYLACEHIAPTPLHAGSPGVIDEHLAGLGLARNLSVRSAHFGQIPLMVAKSLLVLTTGRLFCSRFAGDLPVVVVRCPVDFPPMTYYQLWHDRTHASAPLRWLREKVRDVARGLNGRKGPPPQLPRRTAEPRP